MTPFSEWIKTQTHRPDPVGRLARETVTWAAWPSDTDLENCLAFLKATGSDQYIGGLLEAWVDYRTVIRCTPPAIRPA
jgi:hypothetical protein